MKVKTENPNLVRDTHSKALIVSNQSFAKHQYKKMKAAARAQEERLNRIENDLAEIMSLLKKVLE